MPAIYNKLSARFVISILGVLVCFQVNAQSNNNASVTRAIFSTGIEDREPVDQVLKLSTKYNVVYFFTDLRNLDNEKIIHRWEYEGKVVSSKVFKVDGPRWRVYSKYKLPPDKTGLWSVVVTTEQGLPLRAAIFKYVAEDESAILPIE